jgi:hypothetical protein
MKTRRSRLRRIASLLVGGGLVLAVVAVLAGCDDDYGMYYYETKELSPSYGVLGAGSSYRIGPPTYERWYGFMNRGISRYRFPYRHYPYGRYYVSKHAYAPRYAYRLGHRGFRRYHH